MPYKDPQKEKERLRKYYEANKDLVKARGKKFYEDNREKILKHHAEKKEELKEKCKEWRNKNKNRIKEYKVKNKDKHDHQTKKANKKRRDVLKEDYVVSIIQKATGLSRKEIRNSPELIEAHRYQIKLKRLIKTKKNG